MKKRILVLLLTLALLVFGAVFAVSATDDGEPDTGDTTAATEESTTAPTTVWDELCPCGCGDKLNEVEWKIWGPAPTDTTKIPEGFTADDYTGSYGTTISDRHIIMTGIADANGINFKGTEDTEDTRWKCVVKLGMNGTGTLGNKKEGKRLGTIGYFNTNTDVWIYGAEKANGDPAGTLVTRFVNGTSQNSGCLYVYGGATLTLKNVVTRGITAGEAKVDTITYGTGKNGGLYYIPNNSTITAENCWFNAYNNAYANGGVFYVDGGTLNLTDCTLTQGNASTNGGGIYNNGGTVVMDGGLINNCKASGNGGQVFQSGSAASFTMKNDAQIKANANSTGNSRGVRIQGGVFHMQDTSEIVSTADGYATGNGLYVIAASATCDAILEDSASVVGPKGEYKGNIKLQQYTVTKKDDAGNVTSSTTYTPSLKFVDGWKGKASIAFYDTGEQLAVEGGDTSVHEDYARFYVYDTDGKTLKTSNSAKPASGYELYSEYEDNMCPKFYYNAGQLMAYRSVVMYADGSYGWYLDVHNAINAASASEGAYVKLMCDRNVESNRPTAGILEAYIDLNGYDVNVNMGKNSSGTEYGVREGFVFYLFDSTGSSTEVGSGSVKQAKEGTVFAPITEIGGKTYLTKTVEGVTTAHELVYKISSVALRTSSNEGSLYYTADIACSDMSLLSSWGVAVTVDENATDLSAKHLYTTVTEAVEGNKYNGVLIKGIATNDGTSNAVNAAKQIYAKAYVVIGEGDAAVTKLSTTVNKSLKDVVDAVLELDLTEAQQAVVSTMQEQKWYQDVYPVSEPVE